MSIIFIASFQYFLHPNKNGTKVGIIYNWISFLSSAGFQIHSTDTSNVTENTSSLIFSNYYNMKYFPVSFVSYTTVRISQKRSSL